MTPETAAATPWTPARAILAAAPQKCWPAASGTSLLRDTGPRREAAVAARRGGSEEVRAGNPGGREEGSGSSGRRRACGGRRAGWRGWVGMEGLLMVLDRRLMLLDRDCRGGLEGLLFLVFAIWLFCFGTTPVAIERINVLTIFKCSGWKIFFR